MDNIAFITEYGNSRHVYGGGGGNLKILTNNVVSFRGRASSSINALGPVSAATEQ